MPSALVIAILTALEELLKLSPALIADVQVIFSKGQPTAEDWQSLKDKVNAKSYWDYVPASDLPKPATATDVEPPPGAA
jgi:hypothetical protein